MDYWKQFLMSPSMYNKLSFREEYALHFNISGLHDYWHQIEPKSHVACFFQIGEHLDKYEPSSRSAFFTVLCRGMGLFLYFEIL